MTSFIGLHIHPSLSVKGCCSPYIYFVPVLIVKGENHSNITAPLSFRYLLALHDFKTFFYWPITIYWYKYTLVNELPTFIDHMNIWSSLFLFYFLFLLYQEHLTTTLSASIENVFKKKDLWDFTQMFGFGFDGIILAQFIVQWLNHPAVQLEEARGRKLNLPISFWELWNCNHCSRKDCLGIA